MSTNAVAKETKYYSHVLYFPNRAHFCSPAHCYPSFLGEFVGPLVKARPHLLYWFSFYGSFARFRAWTDDYDELRPELEAKRDLLGLIDKGEEKDLTLERDLGIPRFIGGDSTSTPNQRALKILRTLHAASELVLDSIYRLPNGAWQFEASGDTNQNPIGNHLFSVNHLVHNLSRSQARIAVFSANQNTHVMSYYYYHNAKNEGRLPHDHKLIDEYSVEM
ncbi:MAG: hypothetical protein HZA89_06525 [Verrucomicrobia bacterium]|nr:hypothetical protein [Verrucomicrobiota bacterium]